MRVVSWGVAMRNGEYCVWNIACVSKRNCSQNTFLLPEACAASAAVASLPLAMCKSAVFAAERNPCAAYLHDDNQRYKRKRERAKTKRATAQHNTTRWRPLLATKESERVLALERACALELQLHCMKNRHGTSMRGNRNVSNRMARILLLFLFLRFSLFVLFCAFLLLTYAGRLCLCVWVRCCFWLCAAARCFRYIVV